MFIPGCVVVVIDVVVVVVVVVEVVDVGVTDVVCTADHHVSIVLFLIVRKI